MPVVLPAPVADVKQRYEALSDDDRCLLDAILEVKRLEAAEGDVPWPMEELNRRIARHEAGEGICVTPEEAQIKIKAELARRREARSQCS